MNWTSLLMTIQQEAGLRRPIAVELHCKTKIRDYLIHLDDLPLGTSYNYLGWRFFESFAKHIGPAFRRPHSTQGDGPPRWKQCAMLLEKYAAPVLARGLTLQQQQRKEIEKQVQTVTMMSKSVAEQLVSQSRWLNRDQKSKLLRQVNATRFRVPYVKKSLTSRAFDLQLPEVHAGNYTSAVIGLRKQWVIRMLKRLNPSPELDDSPTQWDFHLTSEMPTSTPTSLAIYFDKIRAPYLRLHGPKWMNYGGFGTFLSRELVKALISEGVGSSIGDESSLWDVWSSSRNASSCLLNLFLQRFGISLEDTREKLLQEFFIDSSSLEIAYEGAKRGAKSGSSSFLPGLEHNSDEQMFYIGYVQTLCETKKSENDSLYIPIRDRINTLVANSKAFNEVFGCSSSPISPKCQIWI